MSAKLNIATAAQLAEKDAYINDDLVDAYIQENTDQSTGNLTYTLSFIKKDEEGPNLSNVVELDYARASEVAAARDFYEMRFVCTDTSGSGGKLDVISEYGDAALLNLEALKPTINRVAVGQYRFGPNFLELANPQVLVGTIEGVVEMTDARTFKTKTITDDGANNIVFTDADDLLNLTNIILTVPKSVIDALGA